MQINQEQRYGYNIQGVPNQPQSNYDRNVQPSSINLTQAGVSNFSQQISSAYQHLQKVQQELVQAQNQIEVQSQAQIRQLRQLQQWIETAGKEVQQIESYSRTQHTFNSSTLS